MANYWTALTRRRLSRQRFLVGAGLTAAGSTTALVLGCSSTNNSAKPKAAGSATTVTTSASGGGTATNAATAAGGTAQASAPSATTAAAQVKPGGTLKVPGYSTDVFDPAITQHSGSQAEGTTACLTGLLSFDEKINILPNMADIPEHPDALTYVFKLKPGIKWQNLPPANGRAFTAEDAVFGLKRFTQPNPEFIYGALLSPIDKYEVVDPQTFKLTLKAPYAPLLAAIAEDWCMMVNREMLDKVGDAGLNKYENLLGTGAWIRGELKQSVSSYLVKNPDYFVKGQPYLDRIEWTTLLDPVARLAAFRSKQLDTGSNLGVGVTKQDADQLKSQLGNQVVSQERRATYYIKIDFHTERDPFKDPRVRRAFHLAIDRQAMEAALGKGNGLFMAAIPQSHPLYAIPEAELLTLPGYRQPKDQDIAEAKKLLAAAGVTGTLKIAARTYPVATQPYSLAAQGALKKIDVELELQEGAPPEITAQRQKSNFQMVLTAYNGANDPDTYLYSQFHSQGTTNFGKYKSAAYDKLAEGQRQELDTDKRRKIVREAQNVLLDEAPTISTYSNVAYLTAWSYVKGMRPIPGLNSGWWSAEVWLDK